MEKVDIAQPRLKNSHIAEVWKKETQWSIMEKVDIAQPRLKNSHSAEVWKKET